MCPAARGRPGGDTLGRRSFTDSLVLGCIPVLFTALQDHAYGWLWGGPGHGPGGWKAAARVLIDRRQFISGRIRLEALLGSMPWPLVELMQETIEAHGRKWQVSREDDPGDEVHALLLGAVEPRRQGRGRADGAQPAADAAAQILPIHRCGSLPSPVQLYVRPSSSTQAGAPSMNVLWRWRPGAACSSTGIPSARVRRLRSARRRRSRGGSSDLNCAIPMPR